MTITSELAQEFRKAHTENVPQIQHTYNKKIDDEITAYCAIGYLEIKCGKTQALDAWVRSNARYHCPFNCKMDWLPTDRLRIFGSVGLVIHLNDDHKQTWLQLADHMETLQEIP